MYHNPSNSTKTLIYPTQLLLKLQFLSIDQNGTYSALNTHLTIPNQYIIPMKTLILLIHKSKTLKILKLKMKNSLKTETRTQ